MVPTASRRSRQRRGNQNRSYHATSLHGIGAHCGTSGVGRDGADTADLHRRSITHGTAQFHLQQSHNATDRFDTATATLIPGRGLSRSIRRWRFRVTVFFQLRPSRRYARHRSSTLESRSRITSYTCALTIMRRCVVHFDIFGECAGACNTFATGDAIACCRSRRGPVAARGPYRGRVLHCGGLQRCGRSSVRSF